MTTGRLLLNRAAQCVDEHFGGAGAWPGTGAASLPWRRRTGERSSPGSRHVELVDRPVRKVGAGELRGGQEGDTQVGPSTEANLPVPTICMLAEIGAGPTLAAPDCCPTPRCRRSDQRRTTASSWPHWADCFTTASAYTAPLEHQRPHHRVDAMDGVEMSRAVHGPMSSAPTAVPLRNAVIAHGSPREPRATAIPTAT